MTHIALALLVLYQECHGGESCAYLHAADFDFDATSSRQSQLGSKELQATEILDYERHIVSCTTYVDKKD